MLINHPRPAGGKALLLAVAAVAAATVLVLACTPPTNGDATLSYTLAAESSGLATLPPAVWLLVAGFLAVLVFAAWPSRRGARHAPADGCAECDFSGRGFQLDSTTVRWPCNWCTNFVDTYDPDPDAL